MIDDDTIRGIAMDSDLLRLANSWHGSAAEFSAFARAVWSLGRDAGLEEAAAECERNDLRHATAVVRALKENKHDR